MEASVTPSRWKRLLRWWGLRAAVVLALCALGWALRHPIARGIGAFLIQEDALAQADALYVLGGSPVERAAEGARLVRAGFAPVAVFTGAPVNEQLAAFGIDSCEAGIGAAIALASGLATDRCVILRAGTSTQEEAAAIRGHAASIGADTVIVVTTEFHTRRVSRVMRKALRGTGITAIVRGARSHRYDADRWWASEEGLIMVNNECVKLLYYTLKH